MADEMKALLAKLLRDFLVSLGRDPVEITDTSKPIGDLGLDSADGIDWVCDLEEHGFEVPEKVNPFVDDQRQQARDFADMAELLASYYTGD